MLVVFWFGFFFFFFGGGGDYGLFCSLYFFVVDMFVVVCFVCCVVCFCFFLDYVGDSRRQTLKKSLFFLCVLSVCNYLSAQKRHTIICCLLPVVVFGLCFV